MSFLNWFSIKILIYGRVYKISIPWTRLMSICLLISSYHNVLLILINTKGRWLVKSSNFRRIDSKKGCYQKLSKKNSARKNKSEQVTNFLIPRMEKKLKTSKSKKIMKFIRKKKIVWNQLSSILMNGSNIANIAWLLVMLNAQHRRIPFFLSCEPWEWWVFYTFNP